VDAARRGAKKQTMKYKWCYNQVCFLFLFFIVFTKDGKMTYQNLTPVLLCQQGLTIIIIIVIIM